MCRETSDPIKDVGSHSRCSRAMAGGLEMCVLDVVNVRSFPGSGCGSFYRGPLHWIHGWGLSMGSIPGVTHWMVFSWGVGGGEEETAGHVHHGFLFR
jgi:hypothetical protein